MVIHIEIQCITKWNLVDIKVKVEKDENRRSENLDVENVVNLEDVHVENLYVENVENLEDVHVENLEDIEIKTFYIIYKMD